MAAGLAAALVLTGCSGSDDGGGDEASSPQPSAAASSAGSGGGSGGGAAGADGVEGSWVTSKEGKLVALMVEGSKAALFSTGGSVCSGTAGGPSGEQKIALKCTDGNKDRAAGVIDSVNSSTMKVTWEGFGEETYTRSEDGKWPEGLPTASLGS
ncbi:hypothetical protein [Streptomyces ureilyticus]|uniref:hypothetical protein n=1 Tax=Streptomyces ureilyticus TaxID=1775131 RepID=UPI002E2AEDF5|nr:hypothetical protein [Streptomyces ureilyticus]